MEQQPIHSLLAAARAIFAQKHGVERSSLIGVCVSFISLSGSSRSAGKRPPENDEQTVFTHHLYTSIHPSTNHAPHNTTPLFVTQLKAPRCPHNWIAIEWKS